MGRCTYLGVYWVPVGNKLFHPYAWGQTLYRRGGEAISWGGAFIGKMGQVAYLGAYLFACNQLPTCHTSDVPSEALDELPYVWYHRPLEAHAAFGATHLCHRLLWARVRVGCHLTVPDANP